MIKKAISFFSLLSFCSVAVSKPLLLDKIPFCDAQPHIFFDMNGDGRKETICTKPVGEKYNGTYDKFKNFYSHEVVLNFSKTHNFSLHSRLLTQSKNAAYEDDTYIEPVNLNGYKHRLLKKKLTGMGIRKAYPYKSSVIYYWDKKKKSVEEFWESD
jgi:hypothetical protein